MMKGFTRRRFLRDSLMGLGAISLNSFALPGESEAQSNDLKALVVIQLLGGLDPYLAFPYIGDEATMSLLRGEYARIPSAGLTEFTPGLGLHPALQNLATTYSGSFKVIMQTGNAFTQSPSRSHEVASLYMLTGGFGNINNRFGWTGRLFDHGVQLEGFGAHSASFNCELCPTPPFTTTNYESFDLSDQSFHPGSGSNQGQGGLRNTKHVDQTLRSLNQITPQRELSDVEKKYRQSQKTMYKAIDDLKLVLQPQYQTPRHADYATMPNVAFAQKLRNIAQRLNYMKTSGQSGKIVFVLSLGGFDIHDKWRTVGDSLMSTIGTSLKLFRDDLVLAGLDKNVVTFCSTEFGRTIEGNGTGTDHGVGYTAFLTGGNVEGGTYGRVIPPIELKGLISKTGNAWPREVSQERLIVELLEKHLNVPGNLAFPSPLYEAIPKYSDLKLVKA